MKTITIFLMFVVLVSALFGCSTVSNDKLSQSMSHEQALQIAERYAKDRGRDLSQYRIVSAEHRQRWYFYYDALDKTQGGHFTVIINEDRGTVGILPGQEKPQEYSATPRSLTRQEAEQIAETRARNQNRDMTKYRLMEVDHEPYWSFFYDGLDGVVGNHFWISINDETGKALITEGE